MRIGQQLAAHRDEIQLAVGDGLVGHVHFDAPGRDDRDGHRFLDLRRERNVQRRLMRRVRTGVQFRPVGVVIGGDGDGVRARRLDLLRIPDGVLDLDAVRLADFA